MKSVNRPAVFLDRDGTLIESVHYLSDPKSVRLVAGAAEGMQRLARAGYAVVLITNQAAVGKGIITLAELNLIHDEMNRQLRGGGANLDGIYFCTVPRGEGDRTVIEHPDRKPAPGMILRAAKELHLDIARSWMVGDAVSDVLAGKNAGCRGSILIGKPDSAEAAELKPLADFHLAGDLTTAIEWILSKD